MAALLEAVRGLVSAIVGALPMLLAFMAGRSGAKAGAAEANADISAAQVDRAAEPRKVPDALVERMRSGEL